MPRRPAKKSKKIARKRQKRPSWKKFKLLKRFKRRLRILLTAMLTLIITTAVLTTASVYQLLKAPFAAASPGSTRAAAHWEGERPINLFFQIEGLRPALLHLDPLGQKNVVLTLPPETDPPKDLGLHLLSTVRVTEAGFSRLRQQTNVTAITEIDRLISLTTIKNLKSILLTLRQEVAADLSLRETALILKHLAENPLDESNIIEISDRHLTDHLAFDSLWENYAYNPQLAKEGQKVLVLNGTQIAGLASRAARTLAHHGVLVLDTANASQTYEESLIIADQTDSATTRLVAEITGIKTVLEKNVDNESSEEGILRSPITIIIGWDQL